MSDQPQNVTVPQASGPADRTGVAVAPTVVKSISQAAPPSPQPQVPARAKETAAVSAEPVIQEVASAAATIEQEPMPPEVEAWMEKVGTTGEEPSLKNLPPVEITAAPPTPASSSGQPAFVLPLGEAELKAGLGAGVNDSLRWLATWCQKIIKQLRGQVGYKVS